MPERYLDKIERLLGVFKTFFKSFCCLSLIYVCIFCIKNFNTSILQTSILVFYCLGLIYVCIFYIENFNTSILQTLIFVFKDQNHKNILG